MSGPDEKNEDFASMLAEFDREGEANKKRKHPQVGEPMRGRVVSIGRDTVFLDLGGKSDGMMEIADLRDADGKLTVAVGDEVEARVVDNGERSGVVVLRRAALGRGSEGKEELQQAYAHQLPVEGVVASVNKGGVEVQIAGVRAFCPISQLDLRHVEDATSYVGQRLSFRITRYEEAGRNLNLVVSRRALLEEESRAQAAVTRDGLKVGSVVRGKVTTLKDYGAFVDLGGLEGMLHVSELGFARVNHPKDVLSVGQEIEVQVLKLEKSDDPKRPEKISLSLKSLERDPWGEVASRFPEGARLAGTVTRVEQYGAFVEIAPGIEGLLHVSELGGGKHVRHAKDAVKPGQPLEVVVLGIEADKHRISLGLASPHEDGDGPAAPSGPAPRFGTFGDLLKKKK